MTAEGMSMQRSARLIMLAALAATGASAARVAHATACASSQAPIVLGGISSLSGTFHFPESARGAAAAFAEVNEACGVDRREIAYVVRDDGGRADAASRAARELALKRHAVALVGGTSAINCRTNAAYFARVDMAVIPGVGTGPECFSSPNISPPNTGVVAITTLALLFASEHLEAKKSCLIGNAHPMLPGNFRGAVARFERISGRKAIIIDQGLHPTDEPAPALKQLLAAGCDAAFVGTLAPYAARLARTMDDWRVDRLQLVLAPEAYTSAFAAKLPARLDGRIFVVTDSDFLDSTRPGMRQAREHLERAGVEPSPFAVQGYLAAEIITTVLRHVRPPITRQSVLAALSTMQPYDTQGLTATPFTFRHPPGQGGGGGGVHVAVLRGGKWAHAVERWIVLPPRATR